MGAAKRAPACAGPLLSSYERAVKEALRFRVFAGAARAFHLKKSCAFRLGNAGGSI